MDWWTTDLQVEGACSEFGPVLSTKFFEDRSNGRSMGTCAVEFATHEQAKACLSKLAGTKIGAKQVQVNWPGKRNFKARCAV